MRGYLYTKEIVWGEWEGRPIELTHVPAVGEHLILDAQGIWYEVRAVAHTLLEEQEYDLELYAVKVEKLTVLRTL